MTKEQVINICRKQKTAYEAMFELESCITVGHTVFKAMFPESSKIEYNYFTRCYQATTEVDGLYPVIELAIQSVKHRDGSTSYKYITRLCRIW